MFGFARWRGLAAARQVNAGLEPAAFRRAYPRLEPTPRVSTKHALALTNPGGADTAALPAQASQIRDEVREIFGIELVNEPVLVGVSL
jgi:UDP-N-acetylmuramate dehydrogenase